MAGLREGFTRISDMHIHTEKSPCADDGYDVNDVVERALQRGITTVAITDHYHGSADKKMLEEVRDQVEEARSEFSEKVEILIGAEADILSVDGDLSIDAEVARTLDILLVGFHHILPGEECMAEGTPLGFENSEQVAEIIAGSGIEAFLSDFRRALLNVLKRPEVSVIAHLLAQPIVVAGITKPRGPIESLDEIGDDVFWSEVFRLAREGGICFEGTGRFPAADRGWGGITEFVRKVTKAGIKFTLASDAHRLEQVGNVDGAINFLEGGGVPAELVVVGSADFHRPK